MSARSTLLARLEKEKESLDARIENESAKLSALEVERTALERVISAIKREKKSAASVHEMPRRKATA